MNTANLLRQRKHSWMPRAFEDFKPAEGVPRMAVDFAIVHVSMMAALAVAVFYLAARGSAGEAQAIAAGFLQYYSEFFLGLSLVFPVVFLLNGFYTHSRAYTGRHKTWVILRGVASAVMTYFGVTFLLFGHERVGRSVAIPFAVIAGAGLCSTRLLKALFEKRYDVRLRNEASRARHPSRVLVVGGAGYIGSLLVERLLERGYTVRVLDTLLYGAESLRPVENHPKFDLIAGDCRNIRDVVKAVQGVDSIIHLAAIVGDPACEQDRLPALEINYAATRMLIEIAKGHGVNRFLFASSCSVYGATEREVDERSPVHPVSLYGQTKVDSEQALLEAASATFHPTILRFATVFGLGYRPRFDLVVNLLTARARQEGAITVFNGRQWRPFIHVRDVVAATIRALEAPVSVAGGEIFNIGDSRLNHTLSDIARIVQQVLPGTRIEHVENPDRRDYRVNFSKASARLGFRARYSVRDGVEELRRAFDEGLITDYTDVRYHNQRFLKAAGTPGHKNEVDGLVMAAFATARIHRAPAAGA